MPSRGQASGPLLQLCDELLLQIFVFLDIPELLHASRVSRGNWYPSLAYVLLRPLALGFPVSQTAPLRPLVRIVSAANNH